MSRQEAVTILRLDNSQHNAAAAQAAQAIGHIGKASDVSAGQVRAAMRSLPAQFTDVATQLAGGQNPLLILLQQGGQVRDQFGSIGAALRGVGSLITPATLGVAGLAALAAVLSAAEHDASKLRNTLALSGNAAGLTEDRFNALARSVAANSRTTESGAKDIALALASQGTVSAGVLNDMAVAVARVAEVSGRTGEDVAKDFARMSGGVADWAAEHNKAWNFITAEQYKYIKRLEEQGKAEEAMLFVSKQITGQLEGQAKNLGWLESAWAGVAKMASGAWQAMLGVGKADTVQQQIDAARVQLSSVEQRIKDARNSPLPAGPAGQGLMQREQDELRQRIANLQEMQRLEVRGADAASARATTEQQRIKALREIDKNGGGSKGPGYKPQFADIMNRQILESEKLFESEDARALAYVQQLGEAREKEAAKRLQAQSELLQGLVDANAKANIDLIADDQQRALAQINLDRMMMQRRIDAIVDSGPARQAAEALADEQAAKARQTVDIKFAKDTALVTREETRDALANAFRDTKNPIKAFGDALGNIIFQRVTTSLADALLTSAFGPGSGFGGGLVGSLLQSFSSPVNSFATAPEFNDWVAGARAGGGPVNAGSTYLVGERGPELLRMGKQGGQIIPNHAMGGGMRITLAPVISIDARSDQAQVAQLVGAAMAQTQRDLWAQMHARGLA